MKIVLRTFIIIYILLFPLFPHIATAQLSKEEQITQLVERFMDERNIPGVSVALLKGSSLFYANAWGVTGGEQKPVELDTPFLLGSISKSLTGLAIAVLIDDGALDLDDSVTTLIPWLTFEDKKANAITIRDLLSQTSGFGSYDGYKLSDRGLKDKEAIGLMAQEVSTLKLTVAPGKIHQYSNANYILLGAVIEEIARQPYSNFMQERIFTPLAMDNAVADKHSAYSNALPSGYESWFGQALPGPDMYDNSGAPYGYIAASANDMMAYLSLLSGYNDDFFNDHTNAKLHKEPLFARDETQSYGFGLPFSNIGTNEEMIWHSGSTPHFQNEIFYIPETGWSGAILTNKTHALEEEGLFFLKQGIIQILNGESLTDFPQLKPNIPVLVTVVVLFTIINSIFLFSKIRYGSIKRPISWFVFSGIQLLITIAGTLFIPHLLGVPWHTFRLFAPDVAFLCIVLLCLFAVNGLLSGIIALKKQQKHAN